MEPQSVRTVFASGSMVCQRVWRLRELGSCAERHRVESDEPKEDRPVGVSRRGLEYQRIELLVRPSYETPNLPVGLERTRR